MRADPAPDVQPAAEVVTVHYRGEADLTALLQSLQGLRVTVVDNSSSSEGTASLLEPFAQVRHVVSGGNVGFARAANLGAASATAPYLLFANPDARPSVEAVAALVHDLDSDPGLAAVAPAVLGGDGRARGGGGRMPSVRSALATLAGPLGFGGARIWVVPDGGLQELDWLSGACLLVRREAFDSVGGFDEHYPLYNEDMALGARLRAAGHRLALDGRVRVLHVGGGSEDQRFLWRARGGALGHFVSREATHPAVVRGLLVAGFLLRSAVSALTGRTEAARENLTVARSVVGGRLPVLAP